MAPTKFNLTHESVHWLCKWNANENGNMNEEKKNQPATQQIELNVGNARFTNDNTKVANNANGSNSVSMLRACVKNETFGFSFSCDAV